MNKKSLAVIFGLGSILIGVLWGIVRKDEVWLSPLGVKPKDKELEFERVVGFLPSWMVGKSKSYGDELTDLVFLGVEVEGDGSLVWDGQGKKISNPNYLKLKSEVKKRGVRNIVGIKLFDDEVIDELLASSVAQNKLIEEVAAVVIAGDFDGVNVDFEYQGDPTAILAAEVTEFMKKLKSKNLGELSTDIFVNTINKGKISQINEMLAVVDYAVIMAYDFHGAGSKIAGPVAPLRAEIGQRSLWEMMERVERIGINKNKLVIALPFYGYEWRTETAERGAGVIRGETQMASLRRANELRKSGQWQEDWDELSYSPRLVKTENNRIYQIYFDDEKSLKEKVGQIKEFGYAGVGFWALGYEGDDDVVSRLVWGR